MFQTNQTNRWSGVNPLEFSKPEVAVKLRGTVAAGLKVRRGAVVGRVTGRKSVVREVPVSKATGSGFVATSPSGTVENGALFVVGDVLKNDAGQTVGTISAIAGNTIVLQANAAVAVAANAVVKVLDGSEKAVAIAEDETDGKDNTPISIITAGVLKRELIIGLTSQAVEDLRGRFPMDEVFQF